MNPAITLLAASTLAALLSASASARDRAGAPSFYGAEDYRPAPVEPIPVLRRPFPHRTRPQQWRRPLHTQAHQQYC